MLLEYKPDLCSFMADGVVGVILDTAGRDHGLRNRRKRQKEIGKVWRIKKGEGEEII